MILNEPIDPGQPPFPQHPQPVQPGPRVRPPTVYVYEKPTWEYKVVVRKGGELLSEQELNALGESGWELAGVVALAAQVEFYFKRPR